MQAFEKDSLTEKVIGLCFRVHTELGPGFPERVYVRALLICLSAEKIKFESEREFIVSFEKRKVGTFRCDLVIENKLILEIKSVTGIMPILFRNQVIAYLKASGIKTRLLINFGNTSCEVKRKSVQSF